MKNAQIRDKILAYDNEQTTAINENKDKIATVEQSVVTTNQKIDDLDTKLSKDYIVDYGSNENGSWEKWASGKLVQWGSSEKTLGNYTSLTMTGVYRTNPVSQDFPIPFVGNLPNVSIRLIRITGENGWQIDNSLPTLQNTGQSMLVRVVQSNTNTTAELVWNAVGRWK